MHNLLLGSIAMFSAINISSFLCTYCNIICVCHTYTHSQINLGNVQQETVNTMKSFLENCGILYNYIMHVYVSVRMYVCACEVYTHINRGKTMVNVEDCGE